MASELYAVFIGDLVNLPSDGAVFVAGILLGCEGSLLKKLSLSFMIISLTSSFSVLIDNYLLSADSGIPTEQERIVYLSVKLLFYLMIYCSVKKICPEEIL